MTLICASISETETDGRWELRALYGNFSDRPQSFFIGLLKQGDCTGDLDGCGRDASVLYEVLGPAGWVPGLVPGSALYFKGTIELDLDPSCSDDLFFEDDECCRIPDLFAQTCPPVEFLGPPQR